MLNPGSGARTQEVYISRSQLIAYDDGLGPPGDGPMIFLISRDETNPDAVKADIYEFIETWVQERPGQSFAVEAIAPGSTDPDPLRANVDARFGDGSRRFGSRLNQPAGSRIKNGIAPSGTVMGPASAAVVGTGYTAYNAAKPGYQEPDVVLPPPPSVSIGSPAGGATITSATPTVNGSAGNASGDATTVTLRVYAGSSASGSAGPDAHAHPLDHLMVPSADLACNGTYTLQATQVGPGGTGPRHRSPSRSPPSQPLLPRRRSPRQQTGPPPRTPPLRFQVLVGTLRETRRRSSSPSTRTPCRSPPSPLPVPAQRGVLCRHRHSLTAPTWPSPSKRGPRGSAGAGQAIHRQRGG